MSSLALAKTIDDLSSPIFVCMEGECKDLNTAVGVMKIVGGVNRTGEGEMGTEDNDDSTSSST